MVKGGAGAAGAGPSRNDAQSRGIDERMPEAPVTQEKHFFRRAGYSAKEQTSSGLDLGGLQNNLRHGFAESTAVGFVQTSESVGECIKNGENLRNRRYPF